MCQLTKLVIASWLPRCLPVLPAVLPVLPAVLPVLSAVLPVLSAVLPVLSAVLPNLPVVLVAPLLLNTSMGNTWIQESMQFAATDDVRLRGMDIKVKSVVAVSILTVF